MNGRRHTFLVHLDVKQKRLKSALLVLAKALPRRPAHLLQHLQPKLWPDRGSLLKLLLRGSLEEHKKGYRKLVNSLDETARITAESRYLWWSQSACEAVLP